MENRTREIYKDDFADYLLCLSLDVGEGMLKNGADVGRVEDTIERICFAYGAAHVEVFSIVSMIIAAIRMPDGTYSSQLRRVRQTGNNLNMLEQLNALSRKICRETPPLDEFDAKLHELKRQKMYPNIFGIFASAVGTAAFCLLFGGGIIEAAITFLVGAAISALNQYSPKRLNAMARTVIGAFVASALAAVASMIISGLNVDSIIIGAIMLLVPGLLFGTAMRDLLTGDLLAGMMKTLHAFLQTLMIGFGYMLLYAILGERINAHAIANADPNVLLQFVGAVVATLAFGIAFKVNKRHLLSVTVCGTLTFAVYFAIEMLLGGSLFWAAFASSVFAALFSEIVARTYKTPSIVILTPGIISIVPGGFLYRTVRDFVQGAHESGFEQLTSGAMIALGIAGGVVAVSVIFGIITDHHKSKSGKIHKNVNEYRQKASKH